MPILHLLGGLLLALVVHEAGHALAAKACGARTIRLSWQGTTARVLATFAAPSRVQLGWFYGAGPGANAIAALAFWALGLRLLATAQLLCAASTLVPTRGTDGARLWRLCFRGDLGATAR